MGAAEGRIANLDSEWTIGVLASRGVIQAFGHRLGEDPLAWCEFFSTLSASHLQHMSEDARMAASLAEFEAKFVTSKEKKASWAALCKAWSSISPEQAWQRLKRVTAGNIDEQTLRDTLLARASALVAGPPDQVVALLGDFLDEHIAVELTADDVWEFLRESAGFGPTDWERDQNVRVRIHDVTKQYLDGINADRGPLTEIRRSAATRIAGLLAEPDGPTVVTVAAGAGVGKTAVLGQVLDDIKATRAPGHDDGSPQVVLATRLDRLDGFHDGHSLGAAMRLPGSPAAVLSRVAGGRPALLVLDQVDSFGTGSGRNPARLEAVAEVLREARALGIKVMIACRAFDLDMDDRLAALAGITGKDQQAAGHHVEHLGPLPDDDVDHALRAGGIEAAALTLSLRALLRLPLHLHMLVLLQERGKLDPAGISTRLQLFDKFYAAVRGEAEARQPNAPVVAVSDQLAVLLSERQELSIGAARLGQYPTTVDHLVRAGWLRLDGGRIAFAHEAFFDYAYAQRHMRSDLTLLGLLRSGEQHLFRRAQVRQILALEREQEPDQYLRDVRELLAADDVRPHIKELVMGLVTLEPDPGIEEWQALAALGAPGENPLTERVHWLAARAPGFSQLLLDHGVVAGYLANPATADLGTTMCTIMVRSHPDQVAGLFLPYAGQEGWSGRLIRVLNSAPLERSEQAVSLMIAVIDAGAIDSALRGTHPTSGDLFSLMHDMNGSAAASGARLVAAWLRRRLALLIADGAYTPPFQFPEALGEDAQADPDLQDAGEEADGMLFDALREAQSRRLAECSGTSAPGILAAIAAEDAPAFTRHILPIVREASAASRTGQVDENGEQDEAFGMLPSRSPDHDPTDALLTSLADAIRTAAGSRDPDTHEAVKAMAGSPLATEQLLAAAGFASGHPDLLSDAVAWLQGGPHALAQGWHEDHRELSAQVIAQVCAQLPAEQTREIQERAAGYATDFEKRNRELYGATAQRLLRDIPDANLAAEVRARRSELDRKFPPKIPAPPAHFANGRAIDISVQSPIGIDAVRSMANDQLVNAMRRWSGDDWQPMPDGRLRGGAISFAQVVGAAAGEAPDRFTAVLNELPGDINPVYATHILLGISQVATPEQSLRAAMAACPRTASCGMQIGQLIERAAPHLDAALLAAVGLTEDELLQMLGDILAQPLAPATSAEAVVPDSDDEEALASSVGEGLLPAQVVPLVTGQKLAENLSFRVWNRPEYPALRALAILAPAFPGAAAMLAEQLPRLAASQHLAVRALAIEMSATQAAGNPGEVIRLIGVTLESDGLLAGAEPDPLPADPRVLFASRQLRDLLLRMCWSQYGLIAAPVLARMTSFYDDTVSGTGDSGEVLAAAGQAAHNAAMVTAVAAWQEPEALALITDTAASRQAPFRNGIVSALDWMLSRGDMPDELVTILTQLFNDADDQIARAAGRVVRHLPNGQDALACRLLSAACQAKTFTLDPSPIVAAAGQYQGDISDAVLEIAERFFQLHRSGVGSFRHESAGTAMILGRLVIGIYGKESQNSRIAPRALNLIDDMILARTYGLEEHLMQLDR